ncbi:FAD-dependent oxidoreductase [Conexibacter sp. SYSU D00693]|uniref:FAD-dependent oxidoreductase n=1 Tax=Conexibacter sp. SYSU D00693 TaxID=2812560 RepID=UPI00196ACA11|nr:FAD-dependent oxidoreductase [Conexibacter sp. SYSU D00693]
MSGPLRVAIFGAGPSGFYAASQLLKVAEPEFEVDLFDRLPTPYGLVRAGVAPDHPNIKVVTKAFDKTAKHERFRFFGHVCLGEDVSREELLERYHAVLYAVGTSTDRRMGIPGEDLKGSHPATEFVSWYNGHPDFAELEFELQTAKRVAVIGNGNVAMDVARMIALAPDELAVTDTADHAIDVLNAAGVEEVVILGRRGPAQAAFTNPELREMGELERADVVVDPADLELDEESAAWLASEEAHRTNKLNVEILREYAAREPEGKPMRVRFRFLVSPVEVLGDDDGRVRALKLERNAIQGGRAVGTGETEELDCQLVFRSIGYRGLPLAGIPFDDQRGLIRNEGGRVCDASGAPLPGEYCAGWIKRGPSGVIGTNKKDAQDTVDKLLEDAAAGKLNAPTKDDVLELLTERVEHLVEWTGWEAIDAAERAAGEPQGRPRVKLVEWDALREAGRGAPAA